MSHSNDKSVRRQQQRIQQQASQSNSDHFFNLLTSPALYSVVEALHPEHRERLFPPTETLAMFLTQALNEDRSCQRAVNDAAIHRLVSGLPLCSTTTGGYCRARQRLPLEMVSTLIRYTGALLDKQVPHPWRWQGRRVRLIDGTTVLMPDTLQNQAAYPKHGGQKPGLGFPICRLVGVICLSSGTLLNAGIGRFNGKGSSEQTLLRGLLDTFEAGDVVVGDAFFGTYFLLASLQDKGVDAVFEQMGARRSSVDFRKGKKLGQKDHLVVLNKPKMKPEWMTQAHYDQAPNSLTIREFEAGGKILITTLVSAKMFPRHSLKTLYKSRWNVELDLRNIKITMGMDMLSCKTPEMIEKEIWIYFLAYNLIRLLMAQAAVLADILPRQISFKHTLQLWLSWKQQSSGLSKPVDMTVLFVLIAQNKVGNRGGRIEPRAIKRRPKPYPLLTIPREQARDQVRRYGHPNKIK